ncbi:putative UPF0481 protein At3g02645 isoform X2 [Carya illinoinensis]|uniref:Uncharacterized protein n=1 Tax=Carya illinoinensis TaxID=32201 RepID=A0A922AIG9_CARIL|nr:putative UPF0481 protein At3g02645 isoform X2 [Carya illinoinensis]KAG6678498.1 hypothetical protein I3842_14G083500 [Carya illinoinensis]
MASSSSLDQHEHAQHPSANGTDTNEVLQDPSANGNDVGLQDPFVTSIVDIFGSNHGIEIPPVCVFSVPRFLSTSKPEAYSPKVIGLGPLYHFRSPLHDMDKVGIARNIHDKFNHIEFQKLIRGLLKLLPSIRACYQMYLTDGDERIACTMAIDGLFLFALLCHRSRYNDALTPSDTLLGLLAQTDMSRFHRDEILAGDTMMLQNQIPIFVLKHILQMECSEQLIIEKNLPRLLLGYCKALSPFKVVNKYPDSMALKRTHMLDLLYHLITLTEHELEILIDKEGRDKKERKKEESKKDEKKKDDVSVEYLQLGPTGVLDILSGLPLPEELKKLIELVKVLLGLPWSLLLYLSYKAGVGDQENLMPTASKLSDVGVKFSPDHIRHVRFKRETASVKLPVIKVNANSEVIIRNLMAYEVMFKPEVSSRWVFREYIREYIQLMSGLVKTGKDVKVLRDHDILETARYMKDDEVAKIFSGMREPPFSAQERADHFNWVMRDINHYYNGLLKIKVRKFIKQILKLFVTILLWLVVALYLFGSVYGYPLVFEKSKSFCGSIISFVPSKLVSFSSTRTSSQLLSSGRPSLTPPT